ncbi:MAG TPA: nucleotide exchange factor GrpE [Steroidobacteraceae bacterium]|jgi:molecular chaperone GrpE|nr:nucleotide exchange factor GrpE [Steroidobacteraceae bacterium]
MAETESGTSGKPVLKSGALEAEATTVLPESAAVTAPDDASQQALLAAQEETRQHRDQYLRAVAEMENLRKRAQRDVEQAHRYAVEKLAQELLPVRDSLELAVANAGRGDAASLIAGQEATLKLLARAFEKFAIQPLDPVGEPFDAERHEAMMMRESATAEPDSVLEVVQPGYELNGRLLRPARVVVARSPG